MLQTTEDKLNLDKILKYGIIIFVTMDALIVYPKDKEQLTALKAVMKAMKVAFTQQEEDYPDYVINGVKESLKQANESQLTPYKGIKDMLA